MTPVESEPLPPTPAWLRALAVACVVATFILLGLGSIVTTFRVGMADPIWPTHPWHLAFIDWTESSAGFLIEHTHRLFAFAVGGLVSLFALLTWIREPRPALRWIGLAGLVGLLIAFGLMHRDLIKQVGSPTIAWPTATTGATLGCFSLAVLCGLIGFGRSGGGVRLAVVVILGAVMLQGLLGGLRVRLNELFGTDLAALHGFFAQLIFAFLVAIMAVMFVRQRPTGESVGGIRGLAWGVVALLVVQLFWGALLRHTGWLSMQRLHFLTAFIATAVIVWLIVVVAIRPTARAAFGGAIVTLGVLLGLQVTLGVEAWFSKFSQGILPELQMPVQDALHATIRTLHVLIGASLLATATALAARMGMTGASITPTATRSQALRTGQDRPSPVEVQS